MFVAVSDEEKIPADGNIWLCAWWEKTLGATGSSSRSSRTWQMGGWDELTSNMGEGRWGRRTSHKAERQNSTEGKNTWHPLILFDSCQCRGHKFHLCPEETTLRKNCQQQLKNNETIVCFFSFEYLMVQNLWGLQTRPTTHSHKTTQWTFSFHPPPNTVAVSIMLMLVVSLLLMEDCRRISDVPKG